MLVLRLETKKNIGIYNVGAAINIILSNGRHPEPENDPGLAKFWDKRWKRNISKQIAWHNERRNWYCGFKDYKQLRAWFDGYELNCIRVHNEKAADDRQVYISVYKTDGRKVKYGERQILFRLDESTLVEHISIEDFLNRKLM